MNAGALFAVKWLAVISMTVDHINVVLLDRSIPLLFWLGRLSYPLFAFLIAYNAAFRTANINRYFRRLIWFGLLSQLPYQLALAPQGEFRLNIFATLALGLFAVATAARYRPLLFLWIAFFFMGWLFEQWMCTHWFSFGFAGVFLIATYYWGLTSGTHPVETRVFAWALITLGLLLLNFRPNTLFVETWHYAVLIKWPQMVMPLCVLLILFWGYKSPLSIQTATTCISSWAWQKYAFYLYYPTHLLVLLLLKDIFLRLH